MRTNNRWVVGGVLLWMAPAVACVQDVASDKLFPYVVEFSPDNMKPINESSMKQHYRDICHFLYEHPNEQVVITGYTDTVGTPERNLALGLNYAEVVRAGLMLAGCHLKQLQAISYGEEIQPAVHEGQRTISPRRAEIQLKSGMRKGAADE